MGAEVQGAFVHSSKFWIVVAWEKRAKILESGISILSRQTVAVVVIERFVGKAGFCQYFKNITRSIFQSIYQWIARMKQLGRTRGSLWPTVRTEVFVCVLLLPFMQFRLDKPWSDRLECTDASPGGHGRSWTHYPLEAVISIAALSEGKGLYTNLSLPGGITTDDMSDCPMAQVDMRVRDFKWMHVGRPGHYRHIVLEEANNLIAS